MASKLNPRASRLDLRPDLRVMMHPIKLDQREIAALAEINRQYRDGDVQVYVGTDRDTLAKIVGAKTLDTGVEFLLGMDRVTGRYLAAPVEWVEQVARMTAVAIDRGMIPEPPEDPEPPPMPRSKGRTPGRSAFPGGKMRNPFIGDVAKSIANEVVDAVDSSDFKYFGIRSSGGHFKVGQTIIRKSVREIDGEKGTKKLRGVSVVGLGSYYPISTVDFLKAAEMLATYNHPENNSILLLGSDEAFEGEDPKELELVKPVVLKVFPGGKMRNPRYQPLDKARFIADLNSLWKGKDLPEAPRDYSLYPENLNRPGQTPSHITMTWLAARALQQQFPNIHYHQAKSTNSVYVNGYPFGQNEIRISGHSSYGRVAPLDVHNWSSKPTLADRLAVAVQAAQLGAKTFPELAKLLKEPDQAPNPPAQPCSGTTQVATTTGSYRKAAEMLKDFLAKRPRARVLDYGAGLGLGTEAMRGVLDGIATVEGFEPLPGRAKVQPDYTDSRQIRSKYDGIVNLNVLNVLERGLRDRVLLDIASRLAPGGFAIIGTRKYRGDIDKAKGASPGPEPGSIWLVKSGQQCYQKGFDGNELLEYASDLLGSEYRVRKLSGPAANNIEIERLGKGSRNPHPISPYSDPRLHDRIKDRILASDKGGRPGQWSARKAQLVAQAYEAAGGGYTGRRTPAQASLSRWTKEDWGTRSGKPSIQGPAATGERYLPRAVRESMPDKVYAASTRAKRASIAAGRQFSPQPGPARAYTTLHRTRIA